MDFAVGNYLTFTAQSGVAYRFQNFFINQTVTHEGASYGFMPFGFSGVTVNRTGDNTEASLVFPNNQLSRPWGVEAIKDRWLARVQVMLLDPETRTIISQLHQYYGQVAQGDWDESALKLAVNTVLDAVGTDAPIRRLTQKLIGAIPVTSAVNLQ